MLSVSSGVRLLVQPTGTQYLREGNPGDPAETANVCITAEASPGFFLDRSVIITYELSSSSSNSAGMYETQNRK